MRKKYQQKFTNAKYQYSELERQRYFENQLAMTKQLLEMEQNNIPKLTKYDLFRRFDASTMGDANYNHPEVQHQLACDNAISSPQISNQFLNQMNNLLVNNVFVGWGELSTLAQYPIINKICSIRSQEATSKWIEFGSQNGDKIGRIIELELELERLGLKDIFRRAFELSNLFGGCLIYPKIKGDEVGDERVEELIVNNIKIEKGSLEYFKVIEPMWYVPIRYETADPFSRWFYKPEMWVVLGNMIHESRVMHCVFKEVPNIYKPTYSFNGYSMSQFCVPYVMGAETIRTEIVSIIGRYNINVLKTDMEGIADGEYEGGNAFNYLRNRLAIFNQLRTNMGTLAIDKEEEDFIQLSMTLNNLDTLMSQHFELICSIAETPATKLFGTPPKGFNATGEHEITTFYDSIKAEQSLMTPHLTKSIHLAMLNIWGEIDHDISWNWKPLGQINEFQKSQIKLNTANEIVTLIGSKVITPQQGTERLIDDKDSGWNNLELAQKNNANKVESNVAEPANGTPDETKKPSGVMDNKV